MTIDVVSAELKTVLRKLKLSGMLATLADRLALSRQQKMPHQDFLLMALSDEASRRESLGASMRAAKARLDPEMQLESWDARWNYFRFEFVDGGKTAALGYVKGAMVSRSGWLDNLDADSLLGAARAPREHRPALQQWIAAEQALAIEVVR